MANLGAGITMEQQVKIVAQDEAVINDLISAQAADSWIVQQVTSDGSGNVIVLFTRATTPT